MAKVHSKHKEYNAMGLLKDMIHDLESMVDDSSKISFGVDSREYFGLDDNLEVLELQDELHDPKFKKLLKKNEDNLSEILEPITSGLSNFVIYLISNGIGVPLMTISITDKVGGIIFKDGGELKVIYFYCCE